LSKVNPIDLIDDSGHAIQEIQSLKGQRLGPLRRLGFQGQSGLGKESVDEGGPVLDALYVSERSLSYSRSAAAVMALVSRRKAREGRGGRVGGFLAHIPFLGPGQGVAGDAAGVGGPGQPNSQKPFRL
jgi:hypothetical protein